MLKENELIVLQAYDETMGVFRVLKEFDLQALLNTYQTDQTKYNRTNIFGFTSWLVEEDFITPQDHRAFIVDDFVAEEI